jgi:hypothetical protein
MKNSHEAMEKVLQGLRNAEAPTGMERRILERLEGQASARSRMERRQLRPSWLRVPAGYAVCGVALAGMFALVLAVPVVRRLGYVPARLKGSVAPAAPMAPSPAAAHGVELSSHEQGSRWSGTTNAPRTGLVRVADPVDSPDAVAWSEMQAASQPAPPMPLTEQEKLLLRIAHRGEPVEMAMLDPVLRGVDDAKERAEYLKFFGQSTKPIVEEPAAADQPADQPAHAESEKSAPDQSKMQSTTPTQSGTGDKE